MKITNVKLGIVSLGLLLNVSCNKGRSGINTDPEESTLSNSVETTSKKIFAETSPSFDNAQKTESLVLGVFTRF